jgi:hypothetical protein
MRDLHGSKWTLGSDSFCFCLLGNLCGRPSPTNIKLSVCHSGGAPTAPRGVSGRTSESPELAKAAGAERRYCTTSAETRRKISCPLARPLQSFRYYWHRTKQGRNCNDSVSPSCVLVGDRRVADLSHRMRRRRKRFIRTAARRSQWAATGAATAATSTTAAPGATAAATTAAAAPGTAATATATTAGSRPAVVIGDRQHRRRPHRRHGALE